MSDQYFARAGQISKEATPHRRPEYGRLTGRLVMLTLLISTLLSFVSTGIQVFSTYERDRANFLSEFDNVERSFQRGLESALWEFDGTQVELLLKGILAQAHVEYVSLASAAGEEWSLGTNDLSHEIQTFELSYQKGEEESVPVGTLVAHVSLAEVWENIRENVATILLTNFAKTFAVVYLLLIVFERLVVRHLNFIAAFADSKPWRAGAASLVLPRPMLSKPDELDLIVSAFNKANGQTAEAFELARREQIRV